MKKMGENYASIHEVGSHLFTMFHDKLTSVGKQKAESTRGDFTSEHQGAVRKELEKLAKGAADRLKNFDEPTSDDSYWKEWFSDDGMMKSAKKFFSEKVNCEVFNIMVQFIDLAKWAHRSNTSQRYICLTPCAAFSRDAYNVFKEKVHQLPFIFSKEGDLPRAEASASSSSAKLDYKGLSEVLLEALKHVDLNVFMKEVADNVKDPPASKQLIEAINLCYKDFYFRDKQIKIGIMKQVGMDLSAKRIPSESLEKFLIAETKVEEDETFFTISFSNDFEKLFEAIRELFATNGWSELVEFGDKLVQKNCFLVERRWKAEVKEFADRRWKGVDQKDILKFTEDTDVPLLTVLTYFIIQVARFSDMWTFALDENNRVKDIKARINKTKNPYIVKLAAEIGDYLGKLSNEGRIKEKCIIDFVHLILTAADLPAVEFDPWQSAATIVDGNFVYIEKQQRKNEIFAKFHPDCNDLIKPFRNEHPYPRNREVLRERFKELGKFAKELDKAQSYKKRGALIKKSGLFTDEINIEKAMRIFRSVSNTRILLIFAHLFPLFEWRKGLDQAIIRGPDLQMLKDEYKDVYEMLKSSDPKHGRGGFILTPQTMKERAEPSAGTPNTNDPPAIKREEILEMLKYIVENIRLLKSTTEDVEEDSASQAISGSQSQDELLVSTCEKRKDDTHPESSKRPCSSLA